MLNYILTITSFRQGLPNLEAMDGEGLSPLIELDAGSPLPA
jgi:hypothetical protein